MHVAGYMADDLAADLLGDAAASHFGDDVAAPGVDVHLRPDLLGMVVIVVRPAMPVAGIPNVPSSRTSEGAADDADRRIWAVRARKSRAWRRRWSTRVATDVSEEPDFIGYPWIVEVELTRRGWNHGIDS